MDIRELRAFVSVVDEGGLSAAARRLHVSQSALSQTVQSLERQLGAQLLVRSHLGVEPTADGRRLAREAREVVDHFDRGISTIRSVVGGGTTAEAGVLRVGVPLELPADVLPLAMARLAESHPLTQVEIEHGSSTAQLAALGAGDLDVALVRDRPIAPDLDAVLAVEKSMGVILAASLADELAGPDGVALHDLTRLTWTGFARAESPAWYDQVTATLRVHGVAVDASTPDRPGPTIAEVKVAAVGSGRIFLHSGCQDDPNAGRSVRPRRGPYPASRA